MESRRVGPPTCSSSSSLFHLAQHPKKQTTEHDRTSDRAVPPSSIRIHFRGAGASLSRRTRHAPSLSLSRIPLSPSELRSSKASPATRVLLPRLVIVASSHSRPSPARSQTRQEGTRKRSLSVDLYANQQDVLRRSDELCCFGDVVGARSRRLLRRPARRLWRPATRGGSRFIRSKQQRRRQDEPASAPSSSSSRERGRSTTIAVVDEAPTRHLSLGSRGGRGWRVVVVARG